MIPVLVAVWPGLVCTMLTVPFIAVPSSAEAGYVGFGDGDFLLEQGSPLGRSQEAWCVAVPIGWLPMCLPDGVWPGRVSRDRVLYILVQAACLCGTWHLLAWAEKSKEVRMPNCVFNCRNSSREKLLAQLKSPITTLMPLGRGHWWV